MFKENISQNRENINTDSDKDKGDFAQSEKIWETVEQFDDIKDKKQLRNIWEEKYNKNELSFFSEESLIFLASLSGAMRLNLLSFAAASILVTPEMADRYYEKFPEDILAVDNIFFDKRWQPADMRDYNLFSISALKMNKGDLQEVESVPGYKYLDGHLSQFYNIARRRQEAPKYLLSNFEEGGLKTIFFEFGKAADGLFEVMNEASDRNYVAHNFINPKKIFSEEYKKLPDEQRASFLRKCLAYSQFSLLFEEVYNSEFTPESSKYFSEKNNKHHNVAHSMIYKTYQPEQVYNSGAGAFSCEMSHTFDTGGDVEEYADQKIILAVLEKLKDVKSDKDENTKLVVEFWNKNRNPIFAHAVAEVLSKQNVNLAAAKLLDLLHSEKDKKEPINAMLYRLEFGKIGVSDEGVRYLEKVYDLGEYNNPAYHANRLTSNGEVGVFNEELELIKYFHLGKLDSENKKVKADVLDFAYETLFIGNSKESAAEKQTREKYLEEFRKKYYQISEEDMFKNTGTRLNNLSFKKQGWFLIYFNQASTEEKETLQKFVSEYHEDGISSFLSLEIDQNIGNKIIELGNNMESESVRIVFSKISEITDLAEKESDEIMHLFLQDGAQTKFDWREVRLALLKNVSEIINKFEAGSAPQKNEDISELLRDLENKKVEMRLLTSVLKTAKENGENISLESVRDFSLERKTIDSRKGVNLVDSEKDSLKKIVKENYQALFLQPGKNYNPEAYERIISGFDKELENLDGQTIYTLKYKGEMVCFSRFKPLSPHEVYGGSFNVIRDVQGLTVGKKFMESVQDEVAKKYDIRIVSRKDNPANSAYERSGFTIIGEHKSEDGVEYYDMVKPARSSVKKAA